MSQKIRELKQQRAKLVADARAILDLGEKEKRALTQEERDSQDKLFADVETLNQTIEREERVMTLELNGAHVTATDSATPSATAKAVSDPEDRTVPEELKKLHQRAIRTFILKGPQALNADMIRAIEEVGNILECREMSAFGAAQSTMLAPQEFTNQIIKDLNKKVAVRRLARAFSVNTLSGFMAPTLAEDTEEFDMTAELTSPAAAADISMGKRELRPHQASKLIKLPTALLQSSAFNIEALAGELMSDKFARTEDSKFCTGNGTQEPLGLFTASALGIPTTRDTVCGSGTDYTWDGLIDVVGALREEYKIGAKWLLPRNAWVRLRKLKDGEGRYVWEPSVQAGEPDTILGYPYEFSDFVPATYTTGLYVGMFGNFDWYWIIDFAFTYVQKLVELYALSNQIALVGRRWFDGAPVQPNAFVRMKLG